MFSAKVALRSCLRRSSPLFTTTTTSSSIISRSSSLSRTPAVYHFRSLGSAAATKSNPQSGGDQQQQQNQQQQPTPITESIESSKPTLNYAHLELVGEQALQTADFFEVKRLIKLEEMFAARVHLGHKEGTLNRFMAPYLFGSRLGHLIIDLEQSAGLLAEALNFAAHIAFRNGIILFVHKSATTGHLVEQTAMRCGEYSHCREWRIGTFTDSTNFFESVTRLPDLLIFLSTLNNIFEPHPAIAEAAKHMIPSIGVVDTNADPCLITYPVPGNDDSAQSVAYFCRLFEAAIGAGKAKRDECLRKPLTEIA